MRLAHSQFAPAAALQEDCRPQHGQQQCICWSQLIRSSYLVSEHLLRQRTCAQRDAKDAQSGSSPRCTSVNSARAVSRVLTKMMVCPSFSELGKIILVMTSIFCRGLSTSTRYCLMTSRLSSSLGTYTCRAKGQVDSSTVDCHSGELLGHHVAQYKLTVHVA